MPTSRILIVDDEPDLLDVCTEILQPLGAEIVAEADSAKALARIQSERLDLALVDIRMPGMNGVELLRSARLAAPQLPVILLTAYPSAETATESVRLGAYDYLVKPFTPDQLRMAASRALEYRRLREERASLERPFDAARKFRDLIGESAPMRQMYEMIDRVAPTDVDVVILGESGTGKELVARNLHLHSRRSDARFVPVDCGAIPEMLLESELFGHEKGAFTGAASSAMGLVEFAHQGTLFLDEVCELPASLQVKLLRTVQERQFRRVGATQTREVDVRILAATNRDIDIEVREGRFREDLYHRLNVVRIAVPPLRERAEDIPVLFNHFVQSFARQFDREIREVDPDVYEILGAFRWPGNVRELQNLAKRVVVLAREGRVTADDLPNEIAEQAGGESSATGYFALRNARIRHFETAFFTRLLKKHRGNALEAAREATLPKGTFYRLLKKHGIRPDDFRHARG